MESVSWSVFSCPQPISSLLHRWCSATSPYKRQFQYPPPQYWYQCWQQEGSSFHSTFQHSLQLKAHPYREAHNMCTYLQGDTQHVLSPQHTPVISCAEGGGGQHKDIWHTGQVLFPLFKKISCRHSCGWGGKADLCRVSLLSDSNKWFWSHYHGELHYLMRSEHHQCNPQASRPGCSVFVFISHSLMQVLSITRMLV